jgi:hypothetical protein
MRIAFNIYMIVFMLFTKVYAEQKRFDNPFEAKDMFGSVGKNDVVWNARGERIEIDFSDSVRGDFSVFYTADSFIPKEVGFMTMPGEEAWDVGFEWTLVMNVKSDNQTAGSWPVKLIDDKGTYALSEMTAATGSEWRKVEFAQTQFSSGFERFNMSKIKAVQILISTGKDKKVWFDDIYFKKNDATIVGVSEKTIDRYVSQDKNTRDQRILNALNAASASSSRNKLNPYFADLYLNRDNDLVNKKLLEIFTSKDPTVKRRYGIDQLWHLSLDSLLIRMYHTFGLKSDIFPGRLKRDTEEALLEVIWERNVDRNDIAIARQSSRHIVANESSDLTAKTAALLSSEIFMNEAYFRDRIYPDHGSGGGYGYWFHQSKSLSQGPHGEGEFKDSKEYKAVDHYYAYLDYFIDFFRERAKRGLFIEHGSTLYAQYLLMPIYDIYSMCGDKKVSEMAGKFLDVYWAVWAQDQITGTRGGARIRDAADVSLSSDSDYTMANFFMGSTGEARGATLSQILSGYHWPQAVWSLALDKKGMGDFEFISRLPGEEENSLPRPKGTERTLMCDTESRFVKYSWITPDHIVGCRMDYPTAVHSYVSASGTKYGVMFASLPGMAVFPWSLEISDESNWTLASESGNFRCVQDKGVMIIQQARNICTVSPQWFPQKNSLAMPIGIYINPAVDQVVEEDGWIFIGEGQSYAAVRVVMGQFRADHRGANDWLDSRASDTPYANIDKDSYKWDRNRSIIRLNDIYSPIIIDTGSKKDFPTIESYIAYVLDGQVALLKTVVPGWYILNYKTADKISEAVEFEFNAANSQVPAVNGKQIDYKPAKLFDSPFIESDYDSGVIRIHKDEYEMTLDFN